MHLVNKEWPLCISHCCFYRLMFINLIQSKFKVDFVLLSFVMSSSVKCFLSHKLC